MTFDIRKFERVWRDAPGLGGTYQVSSDGGIRSRYSRRGGPLGDGWVELSRPTNPSGYHGIYVRRGGKKIKVLVHRLVAMAFIPNPHAKPYINHKNGIKGDNRIENLEWCTQRENVHHAIQTLGRDPRDRRFHKGEKCSWSILSATQVIDIRAAYDGHHGQVTELARKYGVDRTTISAIVNGKNWKGVA